MGRGVAAVILSVIIAVSGLSVSSSEELERPNHIVWQVMLAGQKLNSVYIAEDGRHGWVVSQTGTILATEDGGSHWTPQGLPSSDLWGVAFAADGLHGWVVGSNI